MTGSGSSPDAFERCDSTAKEHQEVGVRRRHMAEEMKIKKFNPMQVCQASNKMAGHALLESLLR